MTDRPILFSAPMVRALLDGRKTQTRRALKPQPLNVPSDAVAEQPYPEQHPHIWCILSRGIGPDQEATKTPVSLRPDAVEYFRSANLRFAPGDRLWVKETWNVFNFSQDGEVAWPLSKIPTREEFEEVQETAVRVHWQIIYRESDRARQWFADQKWRVSIHMPRWASRLTLLVTDVRVERLQDISETDALAEGIVPAMEGFALTPAGECWRPTAAASYAALWDSINGLNAWDANPWVVAITFAVEQRNIDQ